MDQNNTSVNDVVVAAKSEYDKLRETVQKLHGEVAMNAGDFGEEFMAQVRSFINLKRSTKEKLERLKNFNKNLIQLAIERLTELLNSNDDIDITEATRMAREYAKSNTLAQMEEMNQLRMECYAHEDELEGFHGQHIFPYEVAMYHAKQHWETLVGRSTEE